MAVVWIVRVGVGVAACKEPVAGGSAVYDVTSGAAVYFGGGICDADSAPATTTTTGSNYICSQPCNGLSIEFVNATTGETASYSDTPLPTTFQCCALHTASSLAYCVGGVSASPLPLVYRYNVTAAAWLSPVAAPPLLAERTGHSCSISKNDLYVFGGLTLSGADVPTTFFAMDTISLTFKTTYLNSPANRHGHVLVTLPSDNLLLLFGATSTNTNASQLLTYTFNTGSSSWSEYASTTDISLPQTLDGASCTVWSSLQNPTGGVFCFGGETPARAPNSHLSFLNLSSNHWTDLGIPPAFNTSTQGTFGATVSVIDGGNAAVVRSGGFSLGSLSLTTYISPDSSLACGTTNPNNNSGTFYGIPPLGPNTTISECYYTGNCSATSSSNNLGTANVPLINPGWTSVPGKGFPIVNASTAAAYNSTVVGGVSGGNSTNATNATATATAGAGGNDSTNSSRSVIAAWKIILAVLIPIYILLCLVSCCCWHRKRRTDGAPPHNHALRAFFDRLEMWEIALFAVSIFVPVLFLLLFFLLWHQRRQRLRASTPDKSPLMVKRNQQQIYNAASTNLYSVPQPGSYSAIPTVQGGGGVVGDGGKIGDEESPFISLNDFEPQEITSVTAAAIAEVGTSSGAAVTASKTTNTTPAKLKAIFANKKTVEAIGAAGAVGVIAGAAVESSSSSASVSQSTTSSQAATSATARKPPVVPPPKNDLSLIAEESETVGTESLEAIAAVTAGAAGAKATRRYIVTKTQQHAENSSSSSSNRAISGSGSGSRSTGFGDASLSDEGIVNVEIKSTFGSNSTGSSGAVTSKQIFDKSIVAGAAAVGVAAAAGAASSKTTTTGTKTTTTTAITTAANTADTGKKKTYRAQFAKTSGHTTSTSGKAGGASQIVVSAALPYKSAVVTGSSSSRSTAVVASGSPSLAAGTAVAVAGSSRSKGITSTKITETVTTTTSAKRGFEKQANSSSSSSRNSTILAAETAAASSSSATNFYGHMEPSSSSFTVRSQENVVECIKSFLRSCESIYGGKFDIRTFEILAIVECPNFEISLMLGYLLKVGQRREAANATALSEAFHRGRLDCSVERQLELLITLFGQNEYAVPNICRALVECLATVGSVSAFLGAIYPSSTPPNVSLPDVQRVLQIFMTRVSQISATSRLALAKLAARVRHDNPRASTPFAATRILAHVARNTDAAYTKQTFRVDLYNCGGIDVQQRVQVFNEYLEVLCGSLDDAPAVLALFARIVKLVGADLFVRAIIAVPLVANSDSDSGSSGSNVGVRRAVSTSGRVSPADSFEEHWERFPTTVAFGADARNS
ncbi:hypothetical protein HK100_000992, partial [Physocladia obscura]